MHTILNIDEITIVFFNWINWILRKKTPSDSFFRPNGLLYRGGSVRKYR